jgi:CRISPR/Cas system-associated exonuclease Cas4 (RecB family)
LAFHHRKLNAREVVAAHQVHDTFLSAWKDQTCRFEVVYDKRSPDGNLALGVALIETYLKEPIPENIVAIEAPMLAPITTSSGLVLEKPLLMVPDLITRQEGGPLKVNEIKTSGRAFSESEVATSLQPTCYSSALYELTGEEPVVEYAVLVKTKVPKVQRIEVIRTGPDFGRLGDIVEAVERAVNAGVFYPVESPLNCSSCPFFRECRGWTGPGSSMSGEQEVFVTKEAAPCSPR